MTDRATLNEKRIATLLPAIQDKARLLIARCAANGIPLLVTQALRTHAEQDAIYAQGRTAPGKIVTWARGGYSWHNFGRALDVVPVSESGQPIWNDDNLWRRIGTLGKMVGFEWGGDWLPPKRDLPHFQVTNGLTLAQARDNNTHQPV